MPNKETRSIRLRSRLSLLKIYAALFGIFMLLGLWLFLDLRQGYDQVLNQASYRAMQRSQIIGQNLRTKILATDYVLRDVIGRVQKKDLVFPDADTQHAREMSRLLKEKGDTVPDFFSMVLFDSDCLFTATATGQNIGVRSKPALCAARKQFVGAGPMVDYVSSSQSASGRSVLVLSRHLKASDGQFDGGVLGVIELERTQRWFESLDIDGNDSVSLLDHSQVLLARKPFLQSSIEKRVLTSLSFKDLQEKNVASGMARAFDIDGRERLFGYYIIEDFPFTIVYGFAKDQILKQWRKRAIELGIGFCIMLLLAGFVVRAHILTLRQHKELSNSNALLLSSEANFRMLAENMADIVWQTNAQFQVKYMNAADEKVRGFERVEVIGRDIRDQFTAHGQEILNSEYKKRLDLERAGNKGVAMKFELPMRRKDGSEIWVEISSVPIYGHDGEIDGYQGVARDISLRKQHEEALLYEHQELENRLQVATKEKSALQALATLDPLTGLYNRRFLDDAITRELARSEREQKQLAVIMLDLDHFKNVNDQYGHAAGDEVLKSLASLMKKASRESDLICRYGGEEFVAIMPNMSAMQAQERVETWRKQLEETTVSYGESKIRITMSAGIAVYPEHGKQGEELISRADEMLYQSKQDGRNRISVAAA